MAQESRGLEQLTTILSGSNIPTLPSPWQRSQAPYWLLKEKERGSSWGTLVPHSGQASLSEYSLSSPFTTAIVTRPPASLVAGATDSSRRRSRPGLISNRATHESFGLF